MCAQPDRVFAQDDCKSVSDPIQLPTDRNALRRPARRAATAARRTNVARLQEAPGPAACRLAKVRTHSANSLLPGASCISGIGCLTSGVNCCARKTAPETRFPGILPQRGRHQDPPAVVETRHRLGRRRGIGLVHIACGHSLPVHRHTQGGNQHEAACSPDVIAASVDVLGPHGAGSPGSPHARCRAGFPMILWRLRTFASSFGLPAAKRAIPPGFSNADGRNPAFVCRRGGRDGSAVYIML
jgi:hypothetical protein